LSVPLAFCFLALVSLLPAQGTIKFEFHGRYDSLLTGADTAYLKMTIIEFHRKLALAGYASYYKRDPNILARYVDVEPDSVVQISDSVRMTTLQEIASEIELSRDPATFDRIVLNKIRFTSDTLAEVVGSTPFLTSATGDSTPSGVKYLLHRVPKTSHWWVFSTNSAEGDIRYRCYLDFPDETVIEEGKR
jgi:hypothetical protein